MDINQFAELYRAERHRCVLRRITTAASLARQAGVRLAPAFTATTAPTQPESVGPYRLEGFDELGRASFSFAFAPALIDHAARVANFTFALPPTDALRRSLATLRVSSGNVSVERTSAMRAVPLKESAPMSTV